MVFFPVVGALLGLVIAGLDVALGLVLPASIVNGILVVAMLLLTGAIHLDGLIDTCDGLGARGTAQQRWEVMRDSRVGSFGVVGAFSILLLKYLSLGALPESSRLMILLLAPALGRWAAVSAIALFPYARPGGLGRGFKDQVTWARAAMATVMALAIALAALSLQGVAIMLGVWLATTASAAVALRKFEGLTGDTYGAIIEIGELVALLLAIATPAWTW